MTAVRSEQLWLTHQATPGAAEEYTVPAGTNVILKSWFAYASSTTGNTVRLQIYNGIDSWSVTLVNDAPGADGLISWEGWLVLLPGNTVVTSMTAGELFSLGSGAVLPTT